MVPDDVPLPRPVVTLFLTRDDFVFYRRDLLSHFVTLPVVNGSIIKPLPLLAKQWGQVVKR